MTDLAVIEATFCDFRIVKGRKQAQLVFEMPLEKAEEAIKRLGMPRPDNPAWCAIAKLVKPEPKDAEPDKERSERAKEAYRNKPEWQKAAIRAVMLCKDARFTDWLLSHHSPTNWLADEDDEEWTARNMKAELRIESRREIATDERAYKAFLALEQDFRQAVGQAAEIR